MEYGRYFQWFDGTSEYHCTVGTFRCDCKRYQSVFQEKCIAKVKNRCFIKLSQATKSRHCNGAVSAFDSNEKEKPKMQNQICCETCAYYTYDEEWECYVCE